MKNLLTMLFVSFLLVVGTVQATLMTGDYYERYNGDGTSSYYGLSTFVVFNGYLGMGNLYSTNPVREFKDFVGTFHAESKSGEDIYRYAHNPEDNVSINSTSELLWIMENLDATGTYMLQKTGQYGAVMPRSGIGYLLGTNTSALLTAVAELDNLTDQRTGNGTSAILSQTGGESWVLLDSPSSHPESTLWGFALYETEMESGLFEIVDLSGTHNVIPEPATIGMLGFGGLIVLITRHCGYRSTR